MKSIKSILDGEPQIFTTGAFLQPARITDDNGNEKWIWYVSEFIDDSFYEGEVYNHIEMANSKDELTKEPVE